MVGSVQPSHVLAAMGVPAEWASATVRFSIGPHVKDEDGPEIARRVRQVVEHQRALRGWKPAHVIPSIPMSPIHHEVEACPTAP